MTPDATCTDDLTAAREEYAAARTAYERAAREGDWDGVRELVKPAAAAANRASAIHDQLRETSEESRMTAKDRRALETELKPKAAAKNLRLEHRERTAGAWVWDAVDTQTSMVAVRGASLAEMAAYIRGPAAA